MEACSVLVVGVGGVRAVTEATVRSSSIPLSTTKHYDPVYGIKIQKSWPTERCGRRGRGVLTAGHKHGQDIRVAA